MANVFMKNLRVRFKLGKQKIFFEQLTKTSELKDSELAKIASISTRSFQDWKNEKISPPIKTIRLFCKRFNLNLPEDEKVLIDRWIKKKKKIARLGANARFLKHGELATTEGRKKGGRNSIKKKGNLKLLYKSFYKPKKSKKLAEFFGILLGDGGITNYQWFVTLNSVKDKEYTLFVANLSKGLFKVKPAIYSRKDSKVFIVACSRKKMIAFFQKLGLKTGNKVKQQVSVPKWIRRKKEFRIACLRGLMDTDGGIFIHRYKVNGKIYKYKKLCFTNYSIPLLNFVYKTLSNMGLNPKIITKVENKKVWLYNTQEVKQYLKLVGSNNKRLLRYKV